MEDSLYEEHLAPPEGVAVSTIVNSPTTDTLDSVALETSPTDEQDLVEEELLPTDEPSKEEGGDSENHQNAGITFISPADVSIDLNSSVIPSEPQNTFTVDDSRIESAFENSNPQSESQNISSYFAAQNDGDDFFDSIGGGSDQTSAQESTVNDVSTIAEQATETTTPESLDESTDDFQSLAMEGAKAEGSEGDVQQDVTHVKHREHKISASEPETVAFEGVEEYAQEASAISDLAEKDEFESFTAGEGSEVIHHTGLVERSDSLPHGQATVGGEQPAKVEEVGSLVQQLSIQGPSVGTTPTQMSPLHTPVHQPAAAQPPHTTGTMDPPP